MALIEQIKLDIKPFQESLKQIAAGATRLGNELKNVFNISKPITPDIKADPADIQHIKDQINSLDNEKITPQIDTGGVNDSLKKTGEEAQKTGGFLGSVFSGFGVGLGIQAAQKGLELVTGGITTLFEEARKADAIGTAMEIGFRQAGLAGDALAKQMDETTNYARELGFAIGVAPEELKKLSASAASLSGATGQTNKDLTKLAIGIEKATQGAVSGEQALKVFSRGVADPENAEAVDKLTKKFPALGKVLEGAGSVAEKTQAGLGALKGTFIALESDLADAGDSFDNFKRIGTEALQEFGGSILANFDISGLKKGLAEGFDLNAFFATLKSVGTSIGKILTTILNNVLPPLLELKDTFIEIFKNLFTVLKPVFALLGGVILVTIANFIAAIKLAGTIIGEFVSKIKQSLAPIFEKISDLFGSTGASALTLDDILKGFTDTVTLMTDIMSELGGIIADVLVTPFQILYGVINNVVEFFIKLFSSSKDVKNETKSLGETTQKTTGFFTKLGEIILKIPEFLAGLKGAFGAIKQVFFDLGEAITNVFENGISGTIGKIIDIFKGAGTKIGEGFAKGVSDKVLSTLERDFEKLKVNIGSVDLSEALKSIDNFQAVAQSKLNEGKITSEQFAKLKTQLDGLRESTKNNAVIAKQEAEQAAKKTLSAEELEKLQKAIFEKAKEELEVRKENNSLRLRELKNAIELREAETGVKATKEELIEISKIELDNKRAELELAQKLFKVVGAGADVKINANVGENKKAAKKIVNDIEGELSKNQIDLAKLTGKVIIGKDFKKDLDKIIEDFEKQQITIEVITKISKEQAQKEYDATVKELESKKAILQTQLEAATDDETKKVVQDSINKINEQLRAANVRFNGVLDLSLGFTEARKQLDDYLDKLSAEKNVIEVELKTKTDPKDIKDLEDLLKTINQKRADAENAFNKLAADAGEKQFQARIALIEDSAERERLLKIRGLQKQRDDELNNQFLTEEARIAIINRYNEEINKLNKKNTFELAKFTSDSLSSVLSSLLDVSKGATEEQKKNYADAKKNLDDVNAKHKERIDNINKEITALVKGNEKGTASYNQVAEKVAALEEQKRQAVLESAKEIEEANKRVQENSIETSDLIKKNLADSFVKLKETAVTQLNTIGSKIGEAFAKLKADASGNLTNLSDVTTDVLNNLTSASGAAIAAISAGFGELIAKGGANFGDFAKLAATTVLDTVQAAVNAYAAQIFAVNAAALPFGLGVPGALGLIATMNILLSVAKASLGKVGAETGVIGITQNYNKEAGATDTIPLWVAPNESIINAKQSIKYKGILEAINSNKNVGSAIVNTLPKKEQEYLSKYFSSANSTQFAYNDAISTNNTAYYNTNNITNTVQNIRDMAKNSNYIEQYNSQVEERSTRNNKDIDRILNKLDNMTINIDRKEDISISGELVTDGDSITALFNKNLRRKARRY